MTLLKSFAMDLFVYGCISLMVGLVAIAVVNGMGH